jgi:thiamine pyrophosphokinase
LKVVLPNISADIKNAGGEVLLMVLGGRAPDAAWLSSLNFGGEVWAVDKGVEACQRAGLVPGRIIGDCDSAEPSSWQWAVNQARPSSSTKATRT